MDIRTRLFLIVGSLVFFIILISILKKSKISIDMATLWIVFAIGMIVIAVFPEVVYFFTSLIGIESPTNAVYLVVIFVMLILIFYLFMKTSVLENKLNKMIENFAIDKEKHKNEK